MDIAGTSRRLGHRVTKLRNLDSLEQFYAKFRSPSVSGCVPENMVFMAIHPDSSYELAIIGLTYDVPGPNNYWVAHMALQPSTARGLTEINSGLIGILLGFST